MEAPPSPEQNGPQTAAEGLRKVESEIYKPIDPKNYRPETWKRCANSAMGQVQFSKFVTFVIARFRSQSGRLDEVRPFVALLATEGSFDFMTPALEQIPELWMEPPHGPRSPCMILLVKLLRGLPCFKVKGPKVKMAADDSKGKSSEMYENGLSDKEIEIISTTMFGPGSVENSPRKKKLLQSTIELGFPKAALRNAVSLAKLTNTEILRDAQGLPSELWVPKNKAVEPIPSRYDSPYSFLADSMPPGSSNPYVPAVVSLCQTVSEGTTPSPTHVGIASPSSSRAARPDSPSFSTHSHPVTPPSSGEKPMPQHQFARDEQHEVDDDSPPSGLLEEQQGPGSEVDQHRDDHVHRDEMTRIALELRKVDLASLDSEETGSSSKCC